MDCDSKQAPLAEDREMNADPDNFVLRLYVAGQTPKCMRRLREPEAYL